MNFSINNNSQQNGFTLIELAVVIIIMKIISSAVVNSMDIYAKKSRIETTNNRMEQIMIITYYSVIISTLLDVSFFDFPNI
jgi:prepilin-type N-terminal cleavage/methylation domain-containing protein